MRQNNAFLLHILSVIAVCFAKPTTHRPNATTLVIQTTTKTNITTTVDPLSDYPDHIVDYLVKYGYLIEKLDSNGKNATTNTIDKTLYKKSEVVHALREYQDYMSIPATGIVDQNTIKKINQKRCGMPDRIPRSNFHVKMSLTKSGRTKRDTNVFRKGGHSFTNPSSGKKVYYWNIKPYPKLKSYIRPNIWHTLEYAFNRWASVTAIDFIRGDYLGYSDIEVGFWSKGHGDNIPFDGKGGVVGHADPSTSNIHFDDDEDWGELSREMFFWVHPKKGTDFVQAAIHEIGHALGLSHENDTKSAMFPSLQTLPANTIYALSLNDIDRIKASYGKCSPDKIDAIFTNKYLDAQTYIIKGPFIYQIDNAYIEVRQSWPRATTYAFYSTTFVDEAFWHTDFFLYFFDRERYYFFDTTSNPNKVRSGIKKLGKNTYDVGFRGLKHHKYIDAAMVMNYQGKETSFIFQDDYVYKFDMLISEWNRNILPHEQTATGWPKKIADVFPGLPSNIDTAFTWAYDGRTYFFKGKYFYLWDPKNNKVDGLYLVSQWDHVCNIYLCQVAPQPIYNCESWHLTKENCKGNCS